MVTIVAAVVVFGVLVLIHELGHFVMAKKTGMLVKEFAIGFGPSLISRTIGETAYSLRAIPLGGFNDIAGMEKDDGAGARSYCKKPILDRAIVIAAGAAMNLILPVFLFWGIIFYSGIAKPSSEAVMGEVIANTPAAAAGLKDGDRVVEIDGDKINSWDEFVAHIANSDGKTLKVKYERGGKEYAADLTPRYDHQIKRALIGVRGNIVIEHPSFFTAFGLALAKTGNIIKDMIGGISEIIFGRATDEIAGPIGVVKLTGEMAAAGLLPLINFTAILSLNLGIVNLLPIPALDGGHLVVLFIEAVRGKPLGEKALEYTQMVGVACIIAIMLFATKNDIMRIFFP